MLRACVFGGSGFLGSHVADALSAAGYSVRIFDAMPSRWLQPSQEMIVGDITRRNDVNSAVDGSDIVLNFAAVADLNEGLSRPIETIETNVLGNALIMDACCQHGIKRFVYASSVYVHSRHGGFYRCSKQAAEHYVEEYNSSLGLEYTILRYGSLYGPRSAENNGLKKIVSDALRTGTVRYKGSADAIREYIHVEDAARASVAVLEDAYKNESIVVSGHVPMKVLDVLGMLAEILGATNSIEFEEDTYVGHYVRSPYSYSPRPGRKLTMPLHIDLGQGLLQLIEETQAEAQRD